MLPGLQMLVYEIISRIMTDSGYCPFVAKALIFGYLIFEIDGVKVMCLKFNYFLENIPVLGCGNRPGLALL